MTIDEQITYLSKGCVDVVRRQDLHSKLEQAGENGTRLTVKVGFDPTAPDLHLGHTVLIRKMKHFQDLGHRVVFVIGDFTALIGDPTGRSKTRPALTESQIAENAETYKTQVFKILDPTKTEVEFNSRWLGALGSDGVIRLAAKYSVAQMLERREFRQRFESRRPIAIHEFLYPLAQAFDSVHLRADVELGGTDQLFNLNVGRDIMPSSGVEAQVVMTTPLLVGLDGVEKMSKSANNYVGIQEPPGAMFGKLMSTSDELMWSYYELLTDLSLSDLGSMQAKVESGALHPKQAKLNLARTIVSDFHGPDAAALATEEFDRQFAQRGLPSEVAETTISMAPEGARLTRLIVECGFAPSNGAAARLIDQGSVKVDGERVADRFYEVTASRPAFVLQVGKRKVVRIQPALAS